MRACAVSLLLLSVGCGADGPADGDDAGALDAAGERDAGDTHDAASDAGASDAGASDAGASDAGASDAAADRDAASDASTPSRCEVSETQVICPHETRIYRTGVTALTDREIHYQTPLGAPPPAGHPAVLMFQGSLFTSELSWLGVRDAPLGMYHQVLVLKTLLDAGYVVITPEAHLDGSTFWDTNIPPYATFWETSPDHRLMLEIFEGIERGDFGDVDSGALFATGISSGGYMTSRMAVSYPGRFRALAIQSASYATCAGPICSVPDALPADHAPTLFLHGAVDSTVPISTMEPYEAQLSAQGTPTRVVVDPLAGHEWIAEAPGEVLAWFEAAR